MNATTSNVHVMRRRYVPDLTRLLDQCEANYFVLQQLLADATRACNAVVSKDRTGLDAEASCEAEVLETGLIGALALTLVERDRYTCTWSLTEVGGSSQFALRAGGLIVRLYHDAQLAEVLHWHNHRILKGSYPYPNADMLQRDEKQRVNEFLAEWLQHCVRRHIPVYCDQNSRLAGAR